MCSNSLEENPHLLDDQKDEQLKKWRNLLLDIGDRISIYQPEQDGLIFPELPVFETLEQDRQHRKERLVAACRAFALEGFDYGFVSLSRKKSCELKIQNIERETQKLSESKILPSSLSTSSLESRLYNL